MAAPMCWFVHSGARSCGMHRLLRDIRATNHYDRDALYLTVGEEKAWGALEGPLATFQRRLTNGLRQLLLFCGLLIAT